MGACTSDLADNVLTITKEHSHSLKSPIKRALSFTSPPLVKMTSAEDKKTPLSPVFYMPDAVDEKSSLPKLPSSHQPVSKTPSQLESEKRQEHMWRRRVTARLRRGRRRSVEECERVVSRKNAPASPLDEWLTCLDSPLKRSLEKQVRPNEHDEYGLTPLHRACEMGNTTRVKFLLAIGGQADLGTSPSQGVIPPLVYAATNGHAACIKVLVEAGAKVDKTDIWGNTALFKASCYNHTECVQELLTAKANPNEDNKWGALPLQYAALQGHHKVVKMLLEAGADVNLVLEKNVPPPLIGAAMRGYHKSVEEILKYQPEIDVTYQKDTHSALYLSLKHFLLHCNGCDSNMSSASSNARFQCVYTLLMSGAQVSLQCLDLTYCSDTMIPYLVTEEYVLLIKILLKAFPYTAKCHESFASLFEHVTRLGQHKWELVRLVCSTGFTPSRQQLRELSYTFMDSQQIELEEFAQTPRPLMDQCRQAIRGSLTTQNVLSSVETLPLPGLLKDYVKVQSSRSYVI